MPRDPVRQLRLRADELRPPDRREGGGAERFLGRIVDGGAKPTEPGRVYLMEPVRLDGAEAEGAGATVAADASRRVPVVVIGSRAPDVGDLLTAFSVGGRWVAERPRRPDVVACGGCDVPRRDLVISWANTLSGPGMTTLVYDDADGSEWRSACSGQLRYRLTCREGGVSFQATYYSGGPCPTGQPLSCTGPGPSPLGLTPDVAQCDPLLLRWLVTPAVCPSLASRGFTSFTVTL